MVDKLRRFRFTIIFAGAIATAALTSLFREIGVAMSGVMVQLGWCSQGNSLCLLERYSSVAFGLLFLGIILDLSVGKIKARHNKPNLEGLKLAEGAFINYPDHNYYNVTIEEYVFTLVNETEQDLKRCFVLLDEVASRAIKQPDSDWNIISKNVFAKPFRWNGGFIGLDGKRDIEANDKANFAIIVSALSPVLNVTKNETEYFYDFRFAFFDDEGHSLDYGYDYRLSLGIRAKDKAGGNIAPVRYYLYLRVRPVSPGVDVLGIKRLDINTKAAEQRLQRTGFLLRSKSAISKLFTRRKKKPRKTARR
jgi:hypothetical protein